MNAVVPIIAEDAARSTWDLLISHGQELLRPDPPYTVSEWADKHRVLSSKSSAEPGRWRTKRTPYLREIMDNMSAYSPVEEQAVMKGVQIGMSEAGFNFVGYTIQHAPGPFMYVLPILDLAKKFSKTRIEPMIDASPTLREKIAPPRSRDGGNTILEKDFDGGVLFLSGANSEASLRGNPVRSLVLDEVDGYPASVEESGDPVTLAIDRTAAMSARRKIFALSTPLNAENSRIAKLFKEGDQRYYYVCCEACGHAQPITWAAIKWDRDEDGNHLPHTAVFECQGHNPETGEFCGHRHAEHRKSELLAEEGFGGKAKWTPTAKSVRPGLRSYHLSALYSPWYSWAKCVQRFLDSKDDPALLQTFTNNVLGEPWEDVGGEKTDPATLLGKREDYSAGHPETLADEGKFIPDRVALITVGVDVQPDRLELEAVGWGADEESWSLDVRVMPGDPSSQEVWDQLDDYLLTRWPHRAFDNGMPVAATCVDTGGANTMDAYRWVRPREGRRVWGIKGRAGKIPVWPRKPSRTNKGKINLYSIGVDSAKEIVMARLAKVGASVSGAGACHFSTEWDQEQFEQLTAEIKKTRYIKGFKLIEWWKPDHARNERLDCRVYAYAALQGLVIAGVALNREAKRLAAKLPGVAAAGDFVRGVMAPPDNAAEALPRSAESETPPVAVERRKVAKKKRRAVIQPVDY